MNFSVDIGWNWMVGYQKEAWGSKSILILIGFLTIAIDWEG